MFYDGSGKNGRAMRTHTYDLCLNSAVLRGFMAYAATNGDDEPIQRKKECKGLPVPWPTIYPLSPPSRSDIDSMNEGATRGPTLETDELSRFQTKKKQERRDLPSLETVLCSSPRLLAGRSAKLVPG